jgi:hypothetical protein
MFLPHSQTQQASPRMFLCTKCCARKASTCINNGRGENARQRSLDDICFTRRLSTGIRSGSENDTVAGDCAELGKTR